MGSIRVGAGCWQPVGLPLLAMTLTGPGQTRYAEQQDDSSSSCTIMLNLEQCRPFFHRLVHTLKPLYRLSGSIDRV